MVCGGLEYRRISQRTIYSATTFLEKCRKVVLEKWFCKLGFFFWSTTFLEPDFTNQISRTTFLKPLFYTFLEKWLQIKWLNMLIKLQSLNFRFTQETPRARCTLFYVISLCTERMSFKPSLSMKIFSINNFTIKFL